MPKRKRRLPPRVKSGKFKGRFKKRAGTRKKGRKRRVGRPRKIVRRRKRRVGRPRKKK